jgi:hypothetical protein
MRRVVRIVVLCRAIDVEPLRQDVSVGHHLPVGKADFSDERRVLRVDLVEALEVDLFAAREIHLQRTHAESRVAAPKPFAEHQDTRRAASGVRIVNRVSTVAFVVEVDVLPRASYERVIAPPTDEDVVASVTK